MNTFYIASSGYFYSVNGWSSTPADAALYYSYDDAEQAILQMDKDNTFYCSARIYQKQNSANILK